MEKNQTNISKVEALASLKLLNNTQREGVSLFRMPLWMNVMSGLSYGTMTFSYCVMAHDNQWALGFIISLVIFLLLVSFHIYTGKLLGVKANLIPRGKSAISFNIFFGVLFALTLILGKISVDVGYDWVAYVAGIMNGTILMFALYHFPTSSWNSLAVDE